MALLMTLFCGGLFVGCTEEATLEGADKVYITITPSDIILRAGDTIRISAEVTNLSGKIIDTPVRWSVADEAVAKILGDTAVVCLPKVQNGSTTLRATLQNGQYGLANISVTTHAVMGINPIDTAGNVISSYRSYFSPHDSVIFSVAPKELLQEFTPTYAVSGVEVLEDAMTIDTEKGQVTIHFISPRKAGSGSVTLNVAEKEGSCEIQFLPEVFATFYGEKYGPMPYINGGHPDKSTLPQYFAYVYDDNMDINSEATVRVAINVQTGAKEDIEAAYGAYRWEVLSGNSVIISEMRNEYFPEQGFDAVLSVRSGIEKGLTTIRCITPDTVLIANFKVEDFTNDYPVDEITVDRSSLEMKAGEISDLVTGVLPEKSGKYHKPVVTVVDPSIATVGEYNGFRIPITAVGVGSTELLLTANGKELRVPVTVREGIDNVLWAEGNALALFEGQSKEWNLNVRTVTGGPNPYPVNWHSTNESIVTAVAGEGNKGVITALAEGSADITATVDDKTTSPATVKVVAATDRTFDRTNIKVDDSSIYFDGDNLEIVITMNSGSIVKVNALDAGYKTDYNGTYSNNLAVTIDDAAASATGSVTVSAGDEGYSAIKLDLTVTVGANQFTVKADNVQITNW